MKVNFLLSSCLLGYLVFALLSMLPKNLAGIKVVKLLSENAEYTEVWCKNFRDSTKNQYVVDVICSYEASTFIPESSYPERKWSVRVHNAINFYRLGETEMSCQLLRSIQAKHIILEIADLSHRNANYDDLAMYLKCFESIATSPGYVSPFNISILYEALAQHYEKNNKFDLAYSSYSKAAKWYPTIWAEPYISMARIANHEEGPSKSITILRGALKDATLPQSIFAIARELGNYSRNNTDVTDTYCYYEYALEVSQGLSTDYAPDPWRNEMEIFMKSILPSEKSVIDCDKFWHLFGIPK